MLTRANLTEKTIVPTSIYASSLLLALLTFISVNTLAAEAKTEAAAPASNDWKGSVELGFSKSTGNVETTDANFGLTLDKQTAQWRQTAAIKGDKLESKTTTLSERYMTDYKAAYILSSKNYWFGYAGYDANELAAIDKRFVEAFGYGAHLLNSPTKTLEGEIGLGARQTTYTNDLGKDNEAIAHVSLKYAQQLTENTKFTQDLVLHPGTDNSHTTSRTGIQVGMSKNTALKVNYEVQNNTKVFEGVEKKDTSTHVNLVVGF